MSLRGRWHTDTIAQLILLFHDRQGQADSDSSEYKHRPLPPERVDGDAKRKPPDQLTVGEEIKRSRRRPRLYESGHIDPAFHPVGAGPREGVEEKHEEDARVDA